MRRREFIALLGSGVADGHALGGLRVFDPSIMLTITSAYTNATTIMIAENAADMICADRGSDLVAISTSA
jgi:choline dehydrogenase-like flavoprotein